MNKVFVCGDTHMPIDYWKLQNKHWKEQKDLDKGDFLIIAGDFGLIWRLEADKEEKYLTKELANRKFTTLFIDGNHENFERLDALEEIDMFGGKVGKVCDSIYHLKRGYIYNIAGKRYFCFGGAMSTDKQYRIVDISWWDRETQSKEEEERALDNLDACNFQVDHVITHTAPQTIIKQMHWIDTRRFRDPVAIFLEYLDSMIKCKSWHFGHFHEDQLYEDMYYLHYRNSPLRIV